MPEDCDILDCCGDESYGYKIPSDKPDVPALPTFTLTVDSGTVGGSISPPTAAYSQNTFATVTATPETGYQFIGWLGDYEGNDNPAQIYMDADKFISAQFDLITYYVTINIEPGGSATVTGGGQHPYGNTAVISTTPNSGYNFTGYTGDLNTSDNPADLFIDGDKTVTVNLEQIQYDLSLSASPSGGGVPSGSGTYADGAIANISANPAEGFCFYSWTGDVSSVSESETVLMSTDKSVVANFLPEGCCEPYILVLVLDQTGSIGSGGASSGINIIDTSNIHALGVVSFGDSICNVYPITTDLASARAYLVDAVENPGTSPFYCDGGGDTPENGVDALSEALDMLSLYSSSNQKAIYFRTDTIGYAHNTSDPAEVNAELNSELMTLTFLEFGTETDGTEEGLYPDTFPETDKVTWQGFPDCTPP